MDNWGRGVKTNYRRSGPFRVSRIYIGQDQQLLLKRKIRKLSFVTFVSCIKIDNHLLDSKSFSRTCIFPYQQDGEEQKAELWSRLSPRISFTLPGSSHILSWPLSKVDPFLRIFPRVLGLTKSKLVITIWRKWFKCKDSNTLWWRMNDWQCVELFRGRFDPSIQQPGASPPLEEGVQSESGNCHIFPTHTRMQ